MPAPDHQQQTKEHGTDLAVTVVEDGVPALPPLHHGDIGEPAHPSLHPRVVLGQHQGGDQVAPDLTAAEEPEEDAHELVDDVVGGHLGQAAVLGEGQGQGGDVGGLRAPHGSGQGPQGDAEGEEEVVAGVEVGGEVGEVEGEGEGHGPLGGQAVDEPGGQQAGHHRAAVDEAERHHAQPALRVQRALQALQGDEAREHEHEGEAEGEDVLHGLRLRHVAHLESVNRSINSWSASLPSH